MQMGDHASKHSGGKVPGMRSHEGRHGGFSGANTGGINTAYGSGGTTLGSGAQGAGLPQKNTKG